MEEGYMSVAKPVCSSVCLDGENVYTIDVEDCILYLINCHSIFRAESLLNGIGLFFDNWHAGKIGLVRKKKISEQSLEQRITIYIVSQRFFWKDNELKFAHCCLYANSKKKIKKKNRLREILKSIFSYSLLLTHSLGISENSSIEARPANISRHFFHELCDHLIFVNSVKNSVRIILPWRRYTTLGAVKKLRLSIHLC